MRDLDRWGKNIDPEKIFLENERRNLCSEFIGVGFAQLIEMADDFVVARFQHVIGLKQKRAAAAGRIDDLEVPQDGKASPPVCGVIGRLAAPRFLFGNPKLDGRGREALGDHFFNRVLHDSARQFRRRVVRAKLLSLGRLRHGGIATCLFGVAEQPRLLDLLQFRNRPLEEVPQDVEVHLIREVVITDRIEEGRPWYVGQFQFIDCVRREQPAVVLGNAVAAAAGVDEAKEVLEVLPAGIGDSVKAGHGVSVGDGLLGQQAAIFAKGNEDDAIEEALGHFNRRVPRVIPLEVQLGDQVVAVARVGVVEFVADLPLAFGRFFQQGRGTRRSERRRLDQTLAMKEHVELLEHVEVAQRLQGEMLVSPFCRGPLVEPETDDVGDDAPAALGRRIHQIIPALADSGPAVAAVAVEMDIRPFQFDHRQKPVVLRLPKKAQDRVRRFTFNLKMLLPVPDFFSIEGSGVTERIAEHLGQEIALHLRFVEFCQAAGGLKIGPFHKYGVGGFQRDPVEPYVYDGILQKTRQDEAVRLELTERDHRLAGEESLFSHFSSARRCGKWP